MPKTSSYEHSQSADGPNKCFTSASDSAIGIYTVDWLIITSPNSRQMPTRFSAQYAVSELAMVASDSLLSSISTRSVNLIAIVQFLACFTDTLGQAKTMDVMVVTRFGLVLQLRMDHKPLEKQLRRQPLTSMRVTVFRVEDELGLLSLPRHGESAFGLPLRRLEHRTILSTSEELAAAMAYRQAVSIHRHKRLMALRAPKSIIDNEAKLHAIVERLLPVGSLHGNSLFVINNLCECWLLCVDTITDSAASDTKDENADQQTP